MRKFEKIFSEFPFYIFFFPWYSILFLYSQNYIRLAFKVVVLPLLITLLASLVLLACFRFIFRSAVKGGIFTGILALSVFVYGPLHKFLYFNEFSVGPVPIKWDYVYLFLSLVLTLATVVILLKTKRQLVRLNKILNFSGSLLILMAVIPLTLNYFQVHFPKAELEVSQTADNETETTGSGAGSKPDIYYIVPEDYGSPEILKEDYGYDDSRFVNFLKSRGFYIADKSKTNYPFSTFILASVLNINYLNAKNFPAIKHQVGGAVIDNALQNSKVLKFLKNQGYSYFHIGGWYDPLRLNSLADINFAYSNKLNLDQFSDTFLQNTIFYPLVLRYFGLSGRANQIANTLYQFDTLNQMPGQISPKFIFVDILSPHTPYIFDQDCNILRRTPKGPQQQNFLNQLTCTNKKLMATIDNILKHSKNPPVIILQTDEGAKDSDNVALANPDKNGVKGGFREASVETNLERLSILNAFYLPGGKDGLYPEISPVNTFRLVFNQYFNAKLPILPDKYFTFDDYDKLYKFIFNDVTDQVKDK